MRLKTCISFSADSNSTRNAIELTEPARRIRRASRVAVMRNQGLDASRSGLPVSPPHEWTRSEDRRRALTCRKQGRLC
jgi:hypothetical protein